MTKKIWEASLKTKNNSNLYAFEKFLLEKYNKKFNKNYKNLLNWSIKHSPDFWSLFWDFSKIKGIKSKMRTFYLLIRSCFSLFLFFNTNYIW